jgi:hypothetical protein
MKHLKHITIAALLAFSALEAQGQISVQYLQGQKATYRVGDTVTLCVQISVPPETCLDGMNTTKFYQSGISIIRKDAWQEIEKGLWQKDISLIITGNKKANAALTILRRNDKQTISHKEPFQYE